MQGEKNRKNITNTEGTAGEDGSGHNIWQTEMAR